MLLLCVMVLKMCVTLASHFTTGTETYAIEKSAEEGKDTKEENFNKSAKKLLFEARALVDHTHYAFVSHAKPVCRYKMQELSDPPQTVDTPPPNFV